MSREREKMERKDERSPVWRVVVLLLSKLVPDGAAILSVCVYKRVRMHVEHKGRYSPSLALSEPREPPLECREWRKEDRR